MDSVCPLYLLYVFCETVTEPRMTEPRKTERRKTERRKTERRKTEHQKTEPRKGPNIERPNLERDRNFESDWTSKDSLSLQTIYWFYRW